MLYICVPTVLVHKQIIYIERNQRAFILYVNPFYNMTSLALVRRPPTECRGPAVSLGQIVYVCVCVL